MEEQKANGADISGEDINALRTGLMGPMAGIGDTVSQAVYIRFWPVSAVVWHWMEISQDRSCLKSFIRC